MNEAVPHSLSWNKEPKLTASCFPDILPTDRNGPPQAQKIRATVWYPTIPGSQSTQQAISVDLMPKTTKIDWESLHDFTK